MFFNYFLKIIFRRGTDNLGGTKVAEYYMFDMECVER